MIAEGFGDLVAANHKDLNEERESGMHHTCSGCATLGDPMDP